MALVGVKKAYWAKVTQDNDSGLIFDTPIYLEGVQEIDFEPKYDMAKNYAENKVWKQVTSFTEASIKLMLAELRNNNLATITGGHTASAGGVYYTDHDVVPDGALLYCAPTDRDGVDRYGIFYKGQFTPIKRTMKGKEDKTEFQNPELDGTFASTIYNGLTEYHVDTDDPNCPADIADTWFSEVVIPDADSTALTVSTSPADAATGVAVNSNVVWTFNKAISAVLTTANFFLMKATDGTLISGALTIDAAKKVVTLNPSADLSAATAYIAICTTNVSDAVGNHLSANNITNFTTA